MNKHSKRKAKIAVIGLKGLPAFGGAATVGEHIINQLYEQYDFTVYSISSHTPLKSGVYKGICKQKVLSSISLKKLNTLLYYIKTAILVFFSDYDLVHLHHRDAAFIVPFLKLKYPVLLTTHGITGKAKKWRKFKWFLDAQLKYFVKYANTLTCVSKNEQRVLKQKYNLSAEYIPNGISKDIAINHNSQWNQIKKQYIVFAAGRIIEFKGLDILLEALNSMIHAPKLIVVGDLNQEQEYKDKIYELSKGLDVEFLGLIKEKTELFSIIANANIFVFPSRQEAMSVMLLEVASLKVPIIASDIIENRDVFNEEEMLFFETENKDSLRMQLEFALNNKSILDNLMANAFKKLETNYLWRDLAAKYSKLYDNLLKL